jgi:4-hydroxybenzoate polyprenyltransferase and related prenyltransferases
VRAKSASVVGGGEGERLCIIGNFCGRSNGSRTRSSGPASCSPAPGTTSLAQEVALAFVAFCLLASAVYIGNDWLDRDADRAHPTKRDRPLASGRIGGAAAGSLGVVLALAGLAIGAWIGARS